MGTCKTWSSAALCIGSVIVPHLHKWFSINHKQEEDSFYQQIGLKFEDETNKMLHLEHGFVWCWNLDASGSRSQIPGKFEMWCWRRMEKISWTEHVRNEEVLLRIKEQRNMLHEIRKRKANWIGHILRRNCLLKQVIEGKRKGEMEVARRRGSRRKKLLDDLKDRRGYSHLKEEALHRTMWRHRFEEGFGPVVRQNTEWISLDLIEYINWFQGNLL